MKKKVVEAPTVKVVKKYATLSSWSYSVYSQYLKCALSVMFDKIQRIRIEEPPNVHFEKGDRVHKSAESHIKSMGKAPPIIPELMGVKDRLNMFRKVRAMAELEWAFTKDWARTTWFGRDAWLRMKVDVCAVVPSGSSKPKLSNTAPLIQITDWKTGKVYPEHRQQRSLYALGGLQMAELGLLPGIEPGDKMVELIAEHLYTDTTQSATEKFKAKDLKPLKREWTARIKGMMSDTTYRATTGFHCRYCKFRKSAGGPCPEDQ